jgi:hypothetical protein
VKPPVNIQLSVRCMLPHPGPAHQRLLVGVDRPQYRALDSETPTSVNMIEGKNLGSEDKM